MYLELGTADGDVVFDEEALPTIADAELTELGISERNCIGVSRKAED